MTLYKDLDIFRPLGRDRVARTDQGDLFVADGEESQIIRISADGETRTRFGGKGEGPGEFQSIFRIFFWEDHVYVEDTLQTCLHKFNERGDFVEIIRLPKRMARVHRAAAGWVMADFKMFDPEASSQILFFDGALEKETVLMEIEAGDSKSSLRPSRKDGKMVFHFNPSPDFPALAGNSRHPYLYVKHPGPFKISVVDGRSGKVVREIKREESPVIFNEDWGKKLLEKINKGLKNTGGTMEYVPVFPKYFPQIAQMTVTDEGTLIVQKWTSSGERFDAIAFDAQDREIALDVPEGAVHRVLAEIGDEVVLLAFDEEEGVYLLRCKRKQMAEVLEAHPYNWEEAFE